MNKSKELAKLLGIKPIILWCIEGKAIHLCKDIKEAIRAYRLVIYKTKNFENWQQLIKDVRQHIKIINVDFTKPNNFVKLLKLKLDRGTYIYDDCEVITDVWDLENQIIDRLIYKIKLAQNDKNCNLFADLDSFKHGTQQTEWEY